MESSRVARFASAAGAVIAVAGAAFLARAIADEWDAVRSSLADARPGWLVAGLLCATAAMVAIALPWGTALALLGQTADRASMVAWYFVGEIGKYVPGGVWSVVGRAELARRGGVARAASYASVALSLVTLYLAGMLVVALLVPLRFVGHGTTAEVLWVLALLPAGVVVLHPRPLGWLVARAERVVRRRLSVPVPPWSASIGLVARYVPSWLLVGTATWCVARAFDPDVAWTVVAPAAILSWVVGFVLVPVPGGIGVREAVFVASVGALSGGVAATVAVTARLCFLLVDGGGAALSALSWRWLRPRFPGVDGDQVSSRCD